MMPSSATGRAGEMEVLFTFLSERYERRSVTICSTACGRRPVATT